MSNKAPIEGFIQADTQSPTNFLTQEILNTLLEGGEDLDLKTHIIKPKQIASLYTVAKVLEECEFTQSSALLDYFIEKFLRCMISFKRLSRNEVIKALTTVVQEDNPEGYKKLMTEIQKK